MKKSKHKKKDLKKQRKKMKMLEEEWGEDSGYP